MYEKFVLRNLTEISGKGIWEGKEIPETFK